MSLPGQILEGPIRQRYGSPDPFPVNILAGPHPEAPTQMSRI
jgi:hypothetical protein